MVCSRCLRCKVSFKLLADQLESNLQLMNGMAPRIDAQSFAKLTRLCPALRQKDIRLDSLLERDGVALGRPWLLQGVRDNDAELARRGRATTRGMTRSEVSVQPNRAYASQSLELYQGHHLTRV